MSEFKEYTYETKILARQVTDNEGETLITTHGPIHVQKGQWIVNENGVDSVSDDDSFRSRLGWDADASDKDSGARDGDDSGDDSSAVESDDSVAVSKGESSSGTKGNVPAKGAAKK